MKKKVAPCVCLSQTSLLSHLLSPKKHGSRDSIPCHPCSREQILEASPRSTLPFLMLLLLENDFSGNKIKQRSRCSFVALSMVNPQVFWSTQSGLSDCYSTVTQRLKCFLHALGLMTVEFWIDTNNFRSLQAIYKSKFTYQLSWIQLPVKQKSCVALITSLEWSDCKQKSEYYFFTLFFFWLSLTLI